MNASAGTQITWSSTTYTLIAVSAIEVLLRDADGAELRVSLEELNRTASPATPCGPMVPTGASTEEALPREVAVWQVPLERLVDTDDADPVEVRVSREQATLQRALGRTVGRSTIFRKLALYREEGIAGLLDKRRSHATTSSVGLRVVEVLGEVLASRAKSSTVSRAVLIADISRRVRDRYGDKVTVPSRSTLYRLLDAEDRRELAASARTRLRVKLHAELGLEPESDESNIDARLSEDLDANVWDRWYGDVPGLQRMQFFEALSRTELAACRGEAAPAGPLRTPEHMERWSAIARRSPAAYPTWYSW